jgi:hypothetical protein
MDTSGDGSVSDVDTPDLEEMVEDRDRRIAELEQDQANAQTERERLLSVKQPHLDSENELKSLEQNLIETKMALALSEDSKEDLKNRIRKWEKYDDEQMILDAIRKAEKGGSTQVVFK